MLYGKAGYFVNYSFHGSGTGQTRNENGIDTVPSELVIHSTTVL